MVQLTQIISRRNQSSPWRPESLSRRPKLRIKISIEWAGSITNRMGGGIKAEIIRFHSPTKGIRKRRVAVPAKYVCGIIKATCPEHPIGWSKMSCVGESGTLGRTLCSALVGWAEYMWNLLFLLSPLRMSPIFMITSWKKGVDIKALAYHQWTITYSNVSEGARFSCVKLVATFERRRSVAE
jgi:hypothetical protein